MIHTQTIQYRSDDDLNDWSAAIQNHPSDRMLIQVFSGELDETKIREVIERIGSRFPGATVLGATSAGEIVGGQSLDGSVLIHVSCFTQATIRCALVTQNDDLAAAGEQLATQLAQPELKAIIVFGCGIKNRRTIFATAMLEALHARLPDAIIAGGQAGDNGKGERTLVFTAEGITDCGFAAVSVAGAHLFAHNAYTLSWVPIGKKLTITHAEGSRVYTIDGQAPYDIYSHYLGQEVADGLPLSAADFPLMIERDGVLMAIHATGVNPDGSFDYIHHFHAGEQLRFGYCHAGLLAVGAKQLRRELSASEVQAAFVYSCVSRKWILGADILVELSPIASLAPAAGFFCYGEYFGRPHSKPLFLSQTMTVLCLAESDAAVQTTETPTASVEPTDIESRQFKTMRVLHRLVEISAREIESTNLELDGLARKDSLTGLYNRRMFDEQLEREVKRIGRTGHPLSLIILDVDHFKRYNDGYGHVMGDNCLRAVGQILLGIAQRSTDLAARYGGEEFAIILAETDHAFAMTLAEDIRQAIENLNIPHHDSPTARRITVSLGVVTARYEQTPNAESIVEPCDQQLYIAKACGRNRVCGVNLAVDKDGCYGSETAQAAPRPI